VFGSVIAELAPSSTELRHYHPEGRDTS
jgi:hypothetical protein